MVGTVFYFFDVPVYRITEDRYNEERDEYIKHAMYSDPMQRQFYRRNRENASRFEGCLWHAYGGCWKFNEIIGYIRLHLLGSQLRGGYFGIKVKRFVRTRRKTFEYQTYKLAPELEVPADASSAQIYGLILEYLKDCQHELRGRYIDLETLDVLSPYIDWRRMFLRSSGR